MIPELQGLALVLRSTHRLFHRALEGLTPEQVQARVDGANPVLWVAAHVVAVRASYARGLGADVQVPWARQFPRGGQVGDVTEWPTLDQVHAAWDEVHAAFLERLEGVTAEQLAAETRIPGLDGTLLGALGLATLHDAYHLGQLAAARRRFGHERLVG